MVRRGSTVRVRQRASPNRLLLRLSSLGERTSGAVAGVPCDQNVDTDTLSERLDTLFSDRAGRLAGAIRPRRINSVAGVAALQLAALEPRAVSVERCWARTSSSETGRSLTRRACHSSSTPVPPQPARGRPSR